MDVFSKFIIEGDDLILAKVTYHNELVTDISKVRGGGMFSYDSDTKTFTLFGESAQFGRAELDDIIKCFANGSVYFDKYRIVNAFSDRRSNKFEYRIHDGERVKLNGPSSNVADKCEEADSISGNTEDKDLYDLLREIKTRGYSEVYNTHPSAHRQEVQYAKDGVRICIVTENERLFVYVQCTTWVSCGSDAYELGMLPIVAKTILIPLRAARDIIFKYAEILKNSRELAAGDKPVDKSDTEPQYPDVKRKRSGLIWRILGKK